MKEYQDTQLHGEQLKEVFYLYEIGIQFEKENIKSKDVNEFIS